jgi:hypothetical protein
MKARLLLALAAASCAACVTAEAPPVEAAQVDAGRCERGGLCPYPFMGEPPASRGPLSSASALIGAEVLDAEGRNLGRVTDLVIDAAAPSVRYAVLLRSAPTAGEGRRAVPLAALRPGLGRQLVLAPPEGSAATGGGPTGELVRASALIGRAVEVPGQGRIGRIADVLVELETAEAPYALVRLEGDDEPRRAVPLDALRLSR